MKPKLLLKLIVCLFLKYGLSISQKGVLTIALTVIVSASMAGNPDSTLLFLPHTNDYLNDKTIASSEGTSWAAWFYRTLDQLGIVAVTVFSGMEAELYGKVLPEGCRVEFTTIEEGSGYSIHEEVIGTALEQCATILPSIPYIDNKTGLYDSGPHLSKLLHFDDNESSNSQEMTTGFGFIVFLPRKNDVFLIQMNSSHNSTPEDQALRHEHCDDVLDQHASFSEYNGHWYGIKPKSSSDNNPNSEPHNGGARRDTSTSSVGQRTAGSQSGKNSRIGCNSNQGSDGDEDKPPRRRQPEDLCIDAPDFENINLILSLIKFLSNASDFKCAMIHFINSLSTYDFTYDFTYDNSLGIELLDSISQILGLRDTESITTITEFKDKMESDQWKKFTANCLIEILINNFFGSHTFDSDTLVTTISLYFDNLSELNIDWLRDDESVLTTGEKISTHVVETHKSNFELLKIPQSVFNSLESDPHNETDRPSCNSRRMHKDHTSNQSNSGSATLTHPLESRRRFLTGAVGGSMFNLNMAREPDSTLERPARPLSFFDRFRLKHQGIPRSNTKGNQGTSISITALMNQVKWAKFVPFNSAGTTRIDPSKRRSFVQVIRNSFSTIKKRNDKEKSISKKIAEQRNTRSVLYSGLKTNLDSYIKLNSGREWLTKRLMKALEPCIGNIGTTHFIAIIRAASQGEGEIQVSTSLPFSSVPSDVSASALIVWVTDQLLNNHQSYITLNTSEIFAATFVFLLNDEQLKEMSCDISKQISSLNRSKPVTEL